jgi:hypothetical protein
MPKSSSRMASVSPISVSVAFCGRGGGIHFPSRFHERVALGRHSPDEMGLDHYGGHAKPITPSSLKRK